MDKIIRILIVDDHQVVRRGLKTYLELERDLEVVGEAADGRFAVQEYVRLKPDVTLLDLQMEPLSGLDALREIRQLDGTARIVVLTSFLDASHVMPAIEAGANGYLLKTADPDAIVEAVRSAFVGRTTYDPEAMRVLADGIMHRSNRQQLTSREMEVLRLIAQGKSNQEIGDVLYIGLKTVKTHVSSILAKLNLNDRTQAAVYAIREGLIDEDLQDH